MHAVVKWLYVLALVVWVGEVVFFSFVAAPALFRTFPPVEAGRAVGAILPIYYQLAYACLTLVLLGSVTLPRDGRSAPVVGSQYGVGDDRPRCHTVRGPRGAAARDSVASAAPHAGGLAGRQG